MHLPSRDHKNISCKGRDLLSKYIRYTDFFSCKHKNTMKIDRCEEPKPNQFHSFIKILPTKNHIILVYRKSNRFNRNRYTI